MYTDWMIVLDIDDWFHYRTDCDKSLKQEDKFVLYQDEHPMHSLQPSVFPVMVHSEFMPQQNLWRHIFFGKKEAQKLLGS